MAKDLVLMRSRGRAFQAVVILLAAIAQIVCARLTEVLDTGISVELRSAVATHPLVPWNFAFTIWGAIFLFALVSAIWQILPEQKHNRALAAAGWNMAGIWAINALWQVWVPIAGFDWVSVVLVLSGLILGVSGLLKLRQDIQLSRLDEIMVFAPLALVTGWLTAAFSINVTTVLVSGYYALDPSHVGVSLGFLVGLILFGGVMTWMTESLVYAGALMWALFWIMMANIYRDNEPAMVTTSLIGIALIGLVSAWAVTHHHESGPMHVRRG
ncbi:hypothetical protein [Asticcacaulis sp. AC460]|uniref:hypothetical protein n=1 Tax=Asticcacaulis sp. AC460 TaxID=1282360 RepID=UPI0003FEB54A|nr:hypothetical protein [Asticcacaulis sp. AC460]